MVQRRGDRDRRKAYACPAVGSGALAGLVHRPSARVEGGVWTTRRPALVRVAFLLAAVANTFDLVPQEGRDTLLAAVPLMLTIGLAAVGIDTDVRALVGRGMRPLLLALVATSFIALLSLALIAVSS